MSGPTDMDKDELDGYLDQIGAPAVRRMTSTAWRCWQCKRIHESPEPVAAPAPCDCGGISFVKLDLEGRT